MIDSQLVPRLQQGEEEAFRQVYTTHFPKLYRYALTFTHSHEVAEEIVQEVFMTLWRKRQAINPAQSLNHYLYTLTKHRCFRFLQQTARQASLRRELALRLEKSCCSTENEVIYNQYYAIAQEAIRQLPPRRQRIYQMARLEGLPLREIAQQLGISLSTVKNQLLIASQAVKMYFRSHTDHIISWSFLLTVLSSFM